MLTSYDNNVTSSESTPLLQDAAYRVRAIPDSEKHICSLVPRGKNRKKQAVSSYFLEVCGLYFIQVLNTKSF